eukprot:938022-Heterocapsa_arctica.AAC.1
MISAVASSWECFASGGPRRVCRPFGAAQRTRGEMTIGSGRCSWPNTCSMLLPVTTQLPCGSMPEFLLASALVHMV